jgi:hypothetical protein
MRFPGRTALAGVALLAVSAATAAGDDGTRPGDDATTCQQIAIESLFAASFPTGVANEDWLAGRSARIQPGLRPSGYAGKSSLASRAKTGG